MNWLLLLLLLSIIALLNSNSKMILLVHSIPAALVGSFGSVLAKLKHRKMNKIIIFERNVHAYALCVYVCTTYTAFCLFLFSHSRETSYKMVLWIPLWKWVKAKGILQTKVWILDLNIKCVQATLHTHTQCKIFYRLCEVAIIFIISRFATLALYCGASVEESNIVARPFPAKVSHEVHSLQNVEFVYDVCLLIRINDTLSHFVLGPSISCM